MAPFAIGFDASPTPFVRPTLDVPPDASAADGPAIAIATPTALPASGETAVRAPPPAVDRLPLPLAGLLRREQPTAIVPPATATAPPLTHPPVSPFGCRAGDPLANVWGPDRLVILQPCALFRGVVTEIDQQRDGDLHVLIRLDPEYRNLVNPMNVQQLHGDLLGEIVPADQAGCVAGQPMPRPPGGEDVGTCTGAHLIPPAVGRHVEVVGPYVHDLNHGWLEVHPVWSLGPGTGLLPGPLVAPPTATSGLAARETVTKTPGSSTPSPHARETTTTTPTEPSSTPFATVTPRPDPTRVADSPTPTPATRRG